MFPIDEPHPLPPDEFEAMPDDNDDMEEPAGSPTTSPPSTLPPEAEEP